MDLFPDEQTRLALDPGAVLLGGSACPVGPVLIEAVATLVVVALLVGLVLPNLPVRATTPSRMLALVSTSASLLRDARTQAIASNRPVGARFDVARRRFQGGAGVLVIPDDIGFSFRIGRDCRNTERSADLLFWPDGTNCGGVLRFSKSGRVLRTRVNALDGHVDVVEGG